MDKLDTAVEIELKVGDAIDRTKAEVCRLKDDGTLEKIPTKDAGRQVRFEMNKGGVYIVCEPWIQFIMPMWGYCIIIVGRIFIVPVFLIFILKTRKKKT